LRRKFQSSDKEKQAFSLKSSFEVLALAGKKKESPKRLPYFIGSASRDNSNCIEIILPNTIHGNKKKNL